MEHLQKITYVLSIFGPASFFILGLALAYWFWYKHANRLKLALDENEKLQKDINGLKSGDLSKLTNTFKTKLDESQQSLKSEYALKLEESQRDWDVKLAGKEEELTAKSNLLVHKDRELESAKGEVNTLLSSQKDLKFKLGEETKRFADLDLNFGNFKAEKEKEYNLLLSDKESLQADVDGSGSATEKLEDKITHLQSENDRMQLERKSTSQTITNLISKVDALEAEKTAAAENDDSSELEALNLKVSELEGQLNAKDGELGALNSKISGGDLSIFGTGLGIAGLAAGASGTLGLSDVKSKIGDLESQVSAKDAELQSMKAQLEAGAENKVDVSALTPAAFFAGTAATEHERFGYVYGERGDAGHVDDLTDIKGVGEVLQPKLNEYGVYQFKQIALWDQDNIDAFQTDLDFPGRVEREQWVNQAADLHRKNYGEHLAPVVNIYKPAKTGKSKEQLIEEFEGEDVEVSDELGVIYTSRPDEIDDLKLIKGVAKVLEAELHKIGIYRFKQIANWEVSHMTEFSERLAFPGRVERDDWKSQSKQFHKDKYGVEA